MVLVSRDLGHGLFGGRARGGPAERGVRRQEQAQAGDTLSFSIPVSCKVPRPCSGC